MLFVVRKFKRFAKNVYFYNIMECFVDQRFYVALFDWPIDQSNCAMQKRCSMEMASRIRPMTHARNAKEKESF